MAHEGEHESGLSALTACLRDSLRVSRDGRTKKCGVLVVRPAGRRRMPTHAASAARSLEQLVERIRTHVRHSDRVVADDSGARIGIVLYGVDSASTQRVLDRLCVLLDRRSADADAVGGIQLSLGYGTCDLERLADDGARVVRSAWRTRAVVTAALTESAVKPVRPMLQLAIQPSHERHSVEHPQRAQSPSLASRPSVLPLPPDDDRDGCAPPPDVELDVETLRADARTLGVPFVRIPTQISATCRRVLPVELARALSAVPIGRTRGVLTVAMQEPRNREQVLQLRHATGLTVFPVLAAAWDIERGLRQMAE